MLLFLFFIIPSTHSFFSPFLHLYQLYLSPSCLSTFPSTVFLHTSILCPLHAFIPSLPSSFPFLHLSFYSILWPFLSIFLSFIHILSSILTLILDLLLYPLILRSYGREKHPSLSSFILFLSSWLILLHPYKSSLIISFSFLTLFFPFIFLSFLFSLFTIFQYDFFSFPFINFPSSHLFPFFQSFPLTLPSIFFLNHSIYSPLSSPLPLSSLPPSHRAPSSLSTSNPKVR